MKSDLFKTLYVEGMYSDINLTINNKLYNLHKYIISKSKFFQVLIANEKNFNTKDNIIINGVNNLPIPIKFIDDVIEWLYHFDIKLLDHFNKAIDIYFDFNAMLQYYYVSDFLQIDEIKCTALSIIEKYLDSYKSNIMIPNIIEKITSTLSYIINDKEYDTHYESYYSNVMEIFFDIFKKYESCIKYINYLDLSESNKEIYIKYMDYIYVNDKKKFIASHKQTLYYSNLDNRKTVLLMYYVYKKIVNLINLCCIDYLPIITSISISEFNNLLNVINNEYIDTLIQILDVSDWSFDQNGQHHEYFHYLENICIKHDKIKCLHKKMIAYMNFIYLKDNNMN